MLRKLTYFSFFAALTAVSCSKTEDIDRLGELNFERPAAIGGSYMAGYQDGALYTKGQENSIPALIFNQIKEFGGGDFTLPLMTEQAEDGIGLNPKPWESILQTRSRLSVVIDGDGVPSLAPVKQIYDNENLADLNPTYTDLPGQYQCIPFARASNFLNPNFGAPLAAGNPNPFYHRWAQAVGSSTPSSELAAYNPSFVIAWLGVDDIFGYAASGGFNQTIPSAAEFKENLENILEDATSSGAKGVLATIPNPLKLPFFTLVAYNAVELEADDAEDLNGLYTAAGITHIQFQEGFNSFVIEDFDDPSGTGRRQIRNGEHLLLTIPRDSITANLYGLQNPIHRRYVLDLAQVSLINERTNQYNMVIRELADRYDFAVFDANSYFENVKSGIKWNGADFSLEFVSGGFLSLDAINPNQKGYALLANGFIEAINAKYGTKIPNVNCSTCDGVIFP